MTKTIAVLGLVCWAAASAVDAQEFRRLQRLRPVAPAGEPVSEEEFLPVDLDLVENAVRTLFNSWNTPGLGQLLSADFYNNTRLTETLASEVPRNASIRVLAIESISTLAQVQKPLPKAVRDKIGTNAVEVKSTVAVVVRSQLEFDDPELGFQRLEGVNEYILSIAEVIPI